MRQQHVISNGPMLCLHILHMTQTHSTTCTNGHACCRLPGTAMCVSKQAVVHHVNLCLYQHGTAHLISECKCVCFKLQLTHSYHLQAVTCCGLQYIQESMQLSGNQQCKTKQVTCSAYMCMAEPTVAPVTAAAAAGHHGCSYGHAPMYTVMCICCYAAHLSSSAHDTRHICTAVAMQQSWCLPPLLS